MLQHWVDTITIEDINKEAASLLSFASHYGTEAELLEEAAQDPEKFAPPGPTRTTAIVACFPAFTDPSGESIGVTHNPCSNPSMASDSKFFTLMALCRTLPISIAVFTLDL